MKEKADLMEKRITFKEKLITIFELFPQWKSIPQGGRQIRNLGFTFDQQHPLILPKGHHITTLIIEDVHKKNLHASGQLLLSLIRQKFWIPDARNVLRKITQKCLTCFRLKATTATQLMG
jgi:hypothetical protein